MFGKWLASRGRGTKVSTGVLRWEQIGTNIWRAVVQSQRVQEEYRVQRAGMAEDQRVGESRQWQVFFFMIEVPGIHIRHQSPICESREEAQELAERHLADGCVQLPTWPEYLTPQHVRTPQGTENRHGERGE